MQELSYRKQIVRQLRTHYVEGIYRPKYYTVTTKYRLKVTQGYWKRKHWIGRTRLTISRVIWRWILSWPWKFEMWVRGHSRSLKVVPVESLGIVSYSPSIVTMAASLAISQIFSVKEWPDLEIQVSVGSTSLIMARFDRSLYDFLLVRHCNYSCILYRLRVIWRWIMSWPWNLA